MLFFIRIRSTDQCSWVQGEFLTHVLPIWTSFSDVSPEVDLNGKHCSDLIVFGAVTTYEEDVLLSHFSQFRSALMDLAPESLADMLTYGCIRSSLELLETLTSEARKSMHEDIQEI